MKHRMMLKGGGNNVLLAFPCAVTGGGDNCLIVGFAATGGEVNLPGITA